MYNNDSDSICIICITTIVIPFISYVYMCIRSEGASAAAIPRDDYNALAVDLEAAPADQGPFNVSLKQNCSKAMNLNCQGKKCYINHHIGTKSSKAAEAKSAVKMETITVERNFNVFPKRT